VGVTHPDRTGRREPRQDRGTSRILGLVLALMLVPLSAGCFAQNETGLFSEGYTMPFITNPQRVRNEIVKSESYWVQREIQPKEEFPGPTPSDLKAPETDYILGAGDLIDITVYELLAPGQPYVTRQRIGQTGVVTVPYIGSVKCAGLTTQGIEQKLSDMLEPDYLVNPQVSVFVTEYRNLSVSLLNGIMRPGVYPLAKLDTTLLEIVAESGGILQMVEDYGYIIRKYSPEEADMLTLEGTPPEKEGEAGGSEKGVAPKERKKKKSPPEGEAPAEEGKTPAEEGKVPPAEGKAPAVEGKTPPTEGKAPPAPAPKAAPDAKAPPAEKAPGAPAATGAQGETPATGPEAKPPTPKNGKDAGAKTAPASAKDAPAKATTDAEKAAARDALEKMAEGDMPAVKKVEAAESAQPKPDAEATPAEAAPKDAAELGRWVWSNGKWIEVKPEKTEKPAEGTAPGETKVVETKPVEPKPGEAKPSENPERLALEKKLRRLGVVQGSGQLRRIIRFDVTTLQAGDPTQNVVLRDGDIITIPSPAVGDFYMAGEVARPGVYSLTGRKITLLQAVAAAGGLTAVAVPWRTEVIRRNSETEEDIIYVDLSKIARGDAPDFYMQPEDLVRVGTDQGAIFNAVLRNSFRATWGVGGVYDTNFAEFFPWRKTPHFINNE